jgi:hypothetical protein
VLGSMCRRTHPDFQETETIVRVVVACGIVFGAVALLGPAAVGPFGEKKVLTLEIAGKIVMAAESEAARNHLAGVWR